MGARRHGALRARGLGRTQHAGEGAPRRRAARLRLPSGSRGSPQPSKSSSSASARLQLASSRL